MSTYYVDPAATGSATGADWTNAWTSLQSAADTATAGDIVYCRGTQTLTVKIDFDTNSGDDTTGGFIKFIGCNASGTNDGTRFVLDCNSAAASGVYINAKNYLWFENVEVKNGTSSGFDAASSNFEGIVLVNCSSHNNSSHGFDFYYSGYAGVHCIKCVAHNNGSSGFYRPYRFAFFYLCVSHNNTARGFNLDPSSYTVQVIDSCLVYDNTGEGLCNDSSFLIVKGSVFEGNADGIELTSGNDLAILLANRITNNSGYGIKNSGPPLVPYGWNFINSNTTGQTNGTLDAIRDDGTDTNETTGTIGYNDADNDDYNLTSSATLRRVEVELPS